MLKRISLIAVTLFMLISGISIVSAEESLDSSINIITENDNNLPEKQRKNRSVRIERALQITLDVKMNLDLSGSFMAPQTEEETEHDWSEPTYTWNGTASVTASRTCQNCHEEESETVNTTSEVTQQPTCTVMGKTTYTATFTNEHFETQTLVMEDIPANGHTWNEPTYTWNGTESVTASRTCTVCQEEETETANTTCEVITPAGCETEGYGRYTAQFENEAFATQTVEAVIPALGHDYSAPSYIWTANFMQVTATITCSHDSSHNITETVNTTSEITQQPTCTAMGKTTYTATFTNEHFETRTLVVENIPANGHTWSDPTYTWNGTESVTASRTCGICQEEETETANTTCEVITPVGCETDGYGRYTAQFENEAFATQTIEAVIPALGHQWGEWTVTTPATCTQAGEEIRICEHDPTHIETRVIEALGHDYSDPSYVWTGNFMQVTATVTCSRDSSHNITETVNTTSEITQQPTCTAMGKTTYTATFIDEHFETQTLVMEDIPATGHTWGNPTYTWNGTESVTASRTCGVCQEEETETANTTCEVITPAGCETEGYGRYTAQFENEAFTAQTVEAVIPALGHDYGEPAYVWAGNFKQVTATVTCSRESSHSITETVNTTYQIITQATYFSSGLGRYTAAFTSEMFTTQTRDVEIPSLGPQSNPVIQLSLMNTDGIRLQWCEVSKATMYDLYRKVGNGSWTKVASSGSTFRTDNVGRKMGTTYYYKVIAYRGGSQTYSNYSNVVTVVYNPFVDVPSDHAHYSYVKWAYNKSIVNGTSSSTFSPSDGSTRGQLCIMLWKLYGMPKVTGSNPFPDLNGCSDNMVKAILWAKKKGIVQGYEDGTFRPNDNINRYQMAIMLWRVAGRPNVTGTCPFEDLEIEEITDNVRKAIVWAYQKGITKGTTATTYGPLEDCQRSQLACFLYRINNLLKIKK